MARLKYWNGSAWAYLQDGTDGVDGNDAEIHCRRVTADHTITYVNTATYHSLFTNALPDLTLSVGAWAFDLWVRMTHGSTSTAKMIRLNGGGCTIGTAEWSSYGRNLTALDTIVAGGANTSFQFSNVISGSAVIANSAGADWQARMHGVIDVTVAGTFMPQVRFSTADPTGTIAVKAGTFMTLTKIPYFNAVP